MANFLPGWFDCESGKLGFAARTCITSSTVIAVYSFPPSRLLGHELTGDVVESNATGGSSLVGKRVTVNPARACGGCGYCKSGRGNLCRSTIMLGSASTTPPTNGAFAEFVTVRADQCHVLPVGMTDDVGAMMEPFAVALHAVKRSGTVSGKRVVVTGGGPIGLLVLLTSRAFGATPIVVSDIVEGRRKAALGLGADAVLNPQDETIAAQAGELARDGFDVIFEASGSPHALRQAFNMVRPGGTIVQIGTIGSQDIPLPMNQLMVHEIQLLGSFRYGNVFDEAIQLAASGRVHLKPLISDVFPLEKISLAMKRALEKDSVMKVQIAVGKTK